MPVDDASYRAWDGTARPSRLVSFAIASTMIRRLMRNRLLKGLVIFAPVMTCIFASILFGISNSRFLAGMTPIGGRRMQQASGGLEQMLADLNVLAFMNQLLFPNLLFLAVIVAAFAGAPLIAEDRRARALALYFSRPIRHFDYVLGKFLTLACFLGLFLLAPPICMYLTECAMSNVDGTAVAQLPTLWRSLVPGLLACLVFGGLSIGASSLVERTNHAVLLFFGVVMLSIFLAALISDQVLRDPDWQAISPFAAILRIQSDLLALPEQWQRTSVGYGLDVGSAWTSVGLWCVGGFGVLFWRIRKVEVVA